MLDDICITFVQYNLDAQYMYRANFNTGFYSTLQSQKRVCREQLFISGQMTDTYSILRVTIQDGIQSGIHRFHSELFFGQQVRGQQYK